MMAYLLISIVLPASIIFVFSTVVLALFGRSLGVRRLYVRVLLGIFQYARRVARQHARNHQRNFTIGSEGEETEGEEEVDVSISSSPSTNSLPSSWTPSPNEEQPQTAESSDQVDCASTPRRLPRLVSRHNVISRKDDIILNPVDSVVFPEDEREEEEAPDVSEKANDSVTERLIQGRAVSAASFQREFELSDVFDYVRSGVASIIEDEVTQRFEAEELKSWNLLTRTNAKFHHLTWELSAFYWVGCAFRYCFLLPGRLLILLVGLLYMAIGMSLIGPLEEGPWKRWLNYHITTSCFQVEIVSFSPKPQSMWVT
jgi:glycerol-3-phosphate O-acyltransferase 3/4